jgi:hypothetical protein
MPHPAVVLSNYFFSTDAQPFSMDEANITHTVSENYSYCMKK